MYKISLQGFENYFKIIFWGFKQMRNMSVVERRKRVISNSKSNVYSLSYDKSSFIV